MTSTYSFYRGSSSLQLNRYNEDGSSDTSFNGTGEVLTEFPISDRGPWARINSLAVQIDNKIVVGGRTIHRYNVNGSVDSTFGTNGVQTAVFPVNNLAISGNALYAVGGGHYGYVARYLLDDKTDTPPTVSLTTPANNKTYLAPAAGIKLSATASDADGSISKVEFYSGTTLLHTEYVTPYGFKWRNVPVGKYTITAKAYNNSGLVTTSAPVHISVVPNQPPTVSITKPSGKLTVAAPGYIHLEAEAKDADGRITRVEFYNGTTLIRTEYQYPYNYNFHNVPVGTYIITAVAVDNWGAKSTSAPVTVRVVSAPATIVSNKPSSADKNIDVSGPVTLNIAPNPAKDIITIYIQGLRQNVPLSLSVLSSSGALKTMQSNTSVKTIQVDVSSFAKGVYTIKLMSGNKVLTKQFVKM